MSVLLVRFGCSRSRRLLAFIVTNSLPMDCARFSAASPVIKYYSLINPFTVPDWMRYHSPPSPCTVSKIVAAQLL